MRQESASSNNYSETSDSTGKRRKRYVDHPKNISKHNSLIHAPWNSSYECMVLRDFGSRYYKSRPTKDRGHDTATRKKFNIQKDNNAIVNHAADEIIPQENNKVSAEAEAHKNIEYEIYEKNPYHIDNMGLDENKEKTE